MSVFAWCVEGRHVGKKPKYSRVCPGKVGDRVCDCDCHKSEPTPRFQRRRMDA